MITAKVTSKGQITIPKEVRKRMGIQPGDQLEFVENGGLFHLRKYFDDDPIDKWVGYLEHLAGQDPDDLVREMRGQ